jgi:hypothetical protein
MIQLAQKAGQETRDVLSGLVEPDSNGTRRARDRAVPVRLCMLHARDHASVHLGDQMTYRLRSGDKSLTSPPRFEGLFPKQDS